MSPSTLVILTLVSLTFALEDVKHPPVGFIGMSGKNDDTDNLAELQKRAAPMGFHGMRGKKDETDYIQENNGFEKRGPSLGFHGMRGKKDQLDLLHAIDMFEKRGPSFGFHGMRGKKDQDADRDGDNIDKRAYRMGFQGVRGKKDGEPNDDTRYFGDNSKVLVIDDFQDNKLPEYIDIGEDDDDSWPEELDSLSKRAPTGFFGMRGKKLSSGFFGVRGKKGPTNAFFGVRGKKAPSSGFFGVRGKKVPMGFQGVRGKKAGEDNLDSLLHYLNSGEEDYRENKYPTNIRRMPIDFIGMRGIKDWDGIIGQGLSAEQTVNGEDAHDSPAPIPQ